MGVAVDQDEVSSNIGMKEAKETREDLHCEGGWAEGGTWP